jgi:hypothetical protein
VTILRTALPGFSYQNITFAEDFWDDPDNSTCQGGRRGRKSGWDGLTFTFEVGVLQETWEMDNVAQS